MTTGEITSGSGDNTKEFNGAARDLMLSMLGGAKERHGNLVEMEGGIVKTAVPYEYSRNLRGHFGGEVTLLEFGPGSGDSREGIIALSSRLDSDHYGYEVGVMAKPTGEVEYYYIDGTLSERKRRSGEDGKGIPRTVLLDPELFKEVYTKPLSDDAMETLCWLEDTYSTRGVDEYDLNAIKGFLGCRPTELGPSKTAPAVGGAAISFAENR